MNNTFTRARDEIRGTISAGVRNAREYVGTGAILGAGFGGLKLTHSALDSNLGKDVSHVIAKNNLNYITQAASYVPGIDRPEAAAGDVIGFIGATALALIARKVSARVIENRRVA